MARKTKAKLLHLTTEQREQLERVARYLDDPQNEVLRMALIHFFAEGPWTANERMRRAVLSGAWDTEQSAKEVVK